MKFHLFILSFILLFTQTSFAQSSDTLILRDITWDKTPRAGMTELFIPSGNATLAGFIYRANGVGKHPTLLLLHGYPGNERNLDLAQVVRARGWNVIYFDYRGSWGSGGKFSFKNCVEDVVNVIAFCKKYQDSLKIDVSNIVLFGHSMGGWICLKALQQLPEIKKGFALSTWHIYDEFRDIHNQQELDAKMKRFGEGYFVLNTPVKEIFSEVLKDREYYNLENSDLANKQIIMLDEHNHNKQLADVLKSRNKTYFDYEVWQTDHPFTNKRVALIKKVLAFLDK